MQMTIVLLKQISASSPLFPNPSHRMMPEHDPDCLQLKQNWKIPKENAQCTLAFENIQSLGLEQRSSSFKKQRLSLGQSLVVSCWVDSHRVIEWLELEGHLVPTPLHSAGTSVTIAGCLESQTTRPGMVPRMGLTPVLWATWASVSLPSQ